MVDDPRNAPARLLINIVARLFTELGTTTVYHHPSGKVNGRSSSTRPRAVIWLTGGFRTGAPTAPRRCVFVSPPTVGGGVTRTEIERAVEFASDGQGGEKPVRLERTTFETKYRAIYRNLSIMIIER